LTGEGARRYIEGKQILRFAQDDKLRNTRSLHSAALRSGWQGGSL